MVPKENVEINGGNIGNFGEKIVAYSARNDLPSRLCYVK